MKWEKVKLGEYADVLSGYAYKSSDFCGTGVPVIKITNVKPPIISLEEASCISEEIANAKQQYILEYNDVLVAMTGSHVNQMNSVVGRVGRVKYKVKSVLNQRVGKIFVKDNSRLDLTFLYYYLGQEKIKFELANVATGSANQANISPNNIRALLIPCPPLEKQQRIASILSTYDDLIENNQKQIKILEEAAQRLYKEWFVNLRFPGHKDVEFVDGLPKGWEWKKLGEVCFVTDGTHDTPKVVERGIPLVTGKNIKEGFIDFKETYFISKNEHEQIKKRSGLKTGDILFSNIGTLGSCCIVDYSKEFSVKNVIILKIDNVVDTVWLYYWLISDVTKRAIELQASGSSQKFVSLNFMRDFQILVPEVEIIKKFADVVLPIVNMKNNLNKSNLYLSEQRDSLLPKLMSGEVEV